MEANNGNVNWWSGWWRNWFGGGLVNAGATGVAQPAKQSVGVLPPHPAGSVMAPTLKVLDLSHHNEGPHGGDIDFVAIAAFGVKGVILKASQGLANVDHTFTVRAAAARAAGLLVGAYHFAEKADPDGQVQHFLDCADPDDDTLLALDYEAVLDSNGNPDPTRTMTLAGAGEFLHAIEAKLGRKAVLYSGNLIKEQLGNTPDAYLGAHRLWLAHYNDHPKWPAAWAAPWLHQFSGDGVNNHGIAVPGVLAAQAKQLDMNSFAGTDADLAAQWAT